MGIPRPIISSKVQPISKQLDLGTKPGDDYHRAMVRTLNASYNSTPFGLGNANTTYPISAFITDLVYLKDTAVKVDVDYITASGALTSYRPAC